MDKALINKLIYFLKYPFKLWAYECIDQWIMASTPAKSEKKVLVFRLDLLGDYLMSRPFFASLKEGSAWKEYQWTLAGNQLYQSLSENLDGETFASFIWIDRARFINSLGYRNSVLKRIRSAGFEVVIYPSHTRQYWLESVVRVAGARIRICPESIGRYMSPWEQSLSNEKYTQIVSTGPVGMFEFYRNRRFFEQLSSDCKEVKNLIISDKFQENKAFQFEKPYMIVAPGASTRNREWPLGFFAQTARQLATKNGWEVVVIGSPKEKEAGEKLQAALPEIAVHNLAGKTDLTDLLHIIHNGKLLIGNESGPIHLAASVECPAICISQGNHFSRWNPYPASVASWITTVYPTGFGDVEANFEILKQRFHDASDWPIADVGVQAVILAAEKFEA